jgi:release factor glutamine methyltransferase
LRQTTAKKQKHLDSSFSIFLTMAQYHSLRSLNDDNGDSAWRALNATAEERAKQEPTAPLPSLDHLSYKDFDNVYEPAADTFLLLDALQHELRSGIFGNRKDPAFAMEIGCGTGAPSVFLRHHWADETNNRPHLFSFVTDVNPRALEVAKQTAEVARAPNSHHFFEAVRCDLASSFLPRLKGSVSILLFNPPYVPTSDDEVGKTGIEAAWAGGVDGRRVVDRAIEPISQLLERPEGVAYMVTVDDNRPPELALQFRKFGLDMRPLLRRRAFNEMLTIQKIQWMGASHENEDDRSSNDKL